jgi:chromate reductase
MSVFTANCLDSGTQVITMEEVMLNIDPNKPHLLGLSGSLRRQSYSTSILKTLQRRLKGRVDLDIRDARAPLYNEDDEENPAAAVLELRQAIRQSSGLIISTPEYNHGMPGVLKNALDWASRPSGRSSLLGKPVLFITSSPGASGGVRAHAQLNETLLSVQAIIVPGRQIVISNVASKIQGEEFVDEANLAFALEAVQRLLDAALAQRS